MFFTRKPSESLYVKRRLLNYLIIFESILLVALTVLAVQVREIGQEVAPTVNLNVFIVLASFPIIWLCCLSLFGAWDVSILDNHIDGYRRLLKSSLMTFLIFSSASYLFKIQISRFVILFSLLGGTIIHLVLRWIFLRTVDKRMKKIVTKDRWLVLNKNGEPNANAEKFSEEFKVALTYFRTFDDSLDFRFWVENVVAELISKNYSKILLASTEEFSITQIEHLTWLIQQTDTEFIIYDKLGVASAQNQIKRYTDYNWMGVLTPRINDSQRVLKRIFDLVLVTPSLIVLSPIFLAIAIAIKVDSRGSLLYSQKRIGQDEKIFTFPKFRTMIPGSDSKRLEVLGRPDESMTERYKSDPRITRVGRVLRRFSLDELPQLWCVFIGTMSLVGPRPILPEEEEQLGDTHFRRHIAKPGLTGIWQVSGRKDTTWEERMAFDIKYVQNWSIGLDAILIVRTFRAIISGQGSY